MAKENRRFYRRCDRIYEYGQRQSFVSRKRDTHELVAAVRLISAEDLHGGIAFHSVADCENAAWSSATSWLVKNSRCRETKDSDAQSSQTEPLLVVRERNGVGIRDN